MALPIIQDTNVGGRLGQAFAQGINQLAQSKLQMIQDQYQRAHEKSQYAKGLSPVLGNQAAQFLSNLGPEERKVALQNIGPLLELFGGQQQPTQSIPLPGGQPAAQPGQPIPNTGVLSPELLEQIQRGQQSQQPTVNANKIQDIFTSPHERREKETLQLKRMKAVEPQLKAIETEAKPARIVKTLAEDALKILKTGKAKTGVAGAITPKYFQSEEGQQLMSKLNQIVIQRAQLGKGVPSKLRLALEEGSKAAIWQKPKVIESILNDLINEPELQRDIARDEARTKLMEKYGENIPTNIISQIDKEAQVAMHGAKKAKAASFTKSSLPSSKLYPEGARAKNPVTGEYQYIVRNGKWEEYNG